MSSRADAISRRKLLGAGAALAGTALLPRSVWAADPPPKRLVVVFSANGTIFDSWLPQGTETSFTLSPILSALAPFQKKLLVLNGINVKSASNGPGDDHMKGMGHMLTGIELLSGTTQGGAGTPAGFAGGISIDQRIAADIGSSTRFPSLEFGVMVQNSDVWARMIYSGANQPLPPMEDPVAAFSRIFAGSTLSAAQTAILLQRRKSVLDYVQGSLGGLSGRIGADDRVRVQQHLNSVQQIEKQLLAQTGACSAPMVTQTDLTNVANYPAIGKTQMDLLIASLACDQTRIASLQWSHSVSDIPMPWLNISTGHHTLSHDADTDSASQTSLVQINTWYAQQFAYLLQGLDAVVESDGSTLLDNCLVMWINELSKGNIHSHQPLPVVIAGGAGGALRTGRLVTYSPQQPHNNLLVSIANVMGTSITTFGNPAYCTGPLANLT
ncbi:MAG TPA: DUF1552 domain-containing protein [Polyangiaceae bacterium]|nr:DUF1552 domain-containing protein [Polyangiaceae bacterium]